MVPVIQVNLDPSAIIVPADSEWKTLDDFLTYAKAHPGELQYSGTGYAGIWHIATLDLQGKTGTEFTFIPSTGAAPAITELLGGHLDFVACSPPEVSSQVAAGWSAADPCGIRKRQTPQLSRCSDHEGTWI